MKKINERTFGTQLANAQSLATLLAGFNNYQALLPAASLEHFNSLLAAIQQSNSETAAGRQSLSLITEQRKQLFSTHKQSIEHLLAPINTAIRSQYGIKSKAAADISTRVRSMRGLKLAKEARVKMVEGKEVPTKTVSTSHRGFGSLTQSFADVIAAIGELQPAYTPLNKDLTIINLQKKHAELLTVSSKFASSSAEWITKRTLRDLQYQELKDSVLHIKESVKALYGAASTEYVLIKSIKI